SLNEVKSQAGTASAPEALRRRRRPEQQGWARCAIRRRSGALLQRLLRLTRLAIDRSGGLTLGRSRPALVRCRLTTRRSSARGGLAKRSLAWRGIDGRHSVRNRWLAGAAAARPAEVVGPPTRGWNGFALRQHARHHWIG